MSAPSVVPQITSPTPSTAGDGASVSTTTAPARRWAVPLAAALGLIIVLGVGFGPGLAHNAAHDTRHSLAYPCH